MFKIKPTLATWDHMYEEENEWMDDHDSYVRVHIY